MNNNGLWNRTNYLNKTIDTISNTKIYEYDMKQGGYCILKQNGFFTNKEIKYLDTCPKLDRNVYIGRKLINKPEWNKVLIDGFKYIIKRLIEIYNIPDDKILSIKKDAIFLIDTFLGSNLQIEYMELKLENTYTSYYYIKEIEAEFYYNKYKLDVKNINKEVVEWHKDYFLKDLMNIFEIVEKNNYDLLIKKLKRYRKQYVERELPIEHYRELNRDNMYRIDIFNNKTILAESWDDVNSVNIDYNFKTFIQPLIKILI